jgi:ribosomal protein S18 acetylase RimI-like enzyme
LSQYFPQKSTSANPQKTTAPFADAIWNALHTCHRHFALATPLAAKYPADVAPFGALAANSPDALSDLHSLLAPSETIYLTIPTTTPKTILAPTPGLAFDGHVPCLQMSYPTDIPLPDPLPGPEIHPLTCADAPTLLALTHIAFPGYFRIRTCEMGAYFGIFSPAGDLIAMGGERLVLSPLREISGLCTHPDHRGQGHAARLLIHILHHQRSIGAISCLHVAAANLGAIDLYHRLGFQTIGSLLLHRIHRID